MERQAQVVTMIQSWDKDLEAEILAENFHKTIKRKKQKFLIMFQVLDGKTFYLDDVFRHNVAPQPERLHCRICHPPNQEKSTA